jgi:hypothetical protein
VGDGVTSVRNPQFYVAGVPAGATVSLLRNGVLVNVLTSGGGGTVSIGDPGPLLDGQYTYTASLVDGAGNQSPASGPVTISIVTVTGDYTGAGVTNLAVFQRASNGALETFIAGGISPPGGATGFGSGSQDIPFQGDLDGDGKTDTILYRPSTSQWFALLSSGGSEQFTFGSPGDIPLVGDFDGVGHDEVAVYRPSTSQWFVAGHAGVYATFGGPTDIPEVLRNYYGTGQDVLAVYRPGAGQWFIAGQSSPVGFGGPSDVPVPLFNYYGTQSDTLAVFRPSTGQWFVAGQASGIGFGGPGDVPVLGDFDGVGHDELGVYRPSTGQWFVNGHGAAVATFGGGLDIPLEAAYQYRVAGLSTAGIPTSSLYAFNFGATAATTSAPVVTTPPPTAVGTSGSTSGTGTTVTPTPTSGKHPKQSSKHSKLHLHDIALASLQINVKQARKDLLAGN